MDEFDDPALEVAVIEDRVGERLYADQGMVKLLFTNPDKKRFALSFKTPVLVLLHKMVGHVLSQWHSQKAEKGIYFREAGEATVSAFDEMRGRVAIQFDGDIAHILHAETALELAKIIVATVERTETQAEKNERMLKKAPTLFMPKTNIIKP